MHGTNGTISEVVPNVLIARVGAGRERAELLECRIEYVARAELVAPELSRRCDMVERLGERGLYGVHAREHLDRGSVRHSSLAAVDAADRGTELDREGSELVEELVDAGDERVANRERDPVAARALDRRRGERVRVWHADGLHGLEALEDVLTDAVDQLLRRVARAVEATNLHDVAQKRNQAQHVLAELRIRLVRVAFDLVCNVNDRLHSFSNRRGRE